MTNIPIPGGNNPPEPHPNWAEVVHLPLNERPTTHLSDQDQSLQEAIDPWEQTHARIAELETLVAEQKDQLAEMEEELQWQRRQIRTERQFSHAAERDKFTDDLTGLKTQAAFRMELAKAVSDAHRAGTDDVAVIMLDLDGFKKVNDQFGHVAGDELLQVVAEVIRGQSRPGDEDSRWGGDEFAKLMRRFDGAKTARPELVLADRKEKLETLIKQAMQDYIRKIARSEDDKDPDDLEHLGATVVYGRLRPDEDDKAFFNRVDQQLIAEKQRRKAER